MLKYTTVLGALALIAGQAVAEDITADTVVVTVGETEITLGEMIIAKAALPPQFAQLENDVLFEGIIDQLIQQQLLADQLQESIPAIEYTLSNERRTLESAEVYTRIGQEVVTEEAVAAAYEARFADAEDIPEFNASHLLVETQEEAQAAKARVDAGEVFSDVAREVSVGPTAPNGGNLGWFGPNAMVPEFEEAVAALEVGGVTEPFETQFGWHVATLNEKRVQPRPTLEQIISQHANQIHETAVRARLE